MTEEIINKMEQLFVFGGGQGAQVSATRQTFSFECLPRNALLTLPEELLEVVFEHMDKATTTGKGRSISRLMRTCRAAYRIGLPILYRNPVVSGRQVPKLQQVPVHLFALVQTLEATLVSSFLNLPFHLKRMSSIAALSLDFKIRSFGMLEVLQALPRTLRSLTLKGIFDPRFIDLEADLPVLETFRVLEPLAQNQLFDLFDDPFVRKKLTEISVRADCFDVVTNFYLLPALRHVNIMLRPGDTSGQVVSFLEKLPQVTAISLKELNPFSLPRLNLDTIVAILEQISPNIRCIEIASDAFASRLLPHESESLRKVLAKRPKGSTIKVICLAEETEYDGRSMEKINFWKSISGAVVMLKRIGFD